MMKRLGLCAFVCSVALGSTLSAQENQWNGSWKADPSSLQYTGPQFTVTTDAEGFTSTGSGTPQKIVCDGKPQKTDNNTMTACTKSGDTYILDVTRDGKQVRKTTISVSSDGKTRTSKSEITPSDGSSPYTRTTIAERVSGGPGIAGEWRETKFETSTENGILEIHVTGDKVAFKETDTPKPIECRLDGTETKIGDMGSMSVKLADPHTLKVTYRGMDDKVRRENTFELSEDGKTITETDVTPSPMESKMMLKLHKM